MPNHYHLPCFERLDSFIRKKATGTVKELAAKLDVSARTVYNLIKTMKEQGAPIEFCRQRNSYYYDSPGRFHFRFKEDT